MNIAVYRKNVLKTINGKNAKLGLRTLAKSTSRTLTASQILSLKLHTDRLVDGLTPYLLGEQFNPDLQKAAFVAMSTLSKDIVVLSKLLKVKLPTGTKKLKLVGTRSAALLRLNALTADMLDVARDFAFATPPVTTTEKMVNVPKKGKESRQVEVVDAGSLKVYEAKSIAYLQGLFTQVVVLYWSLSFDLFKTPPQALVDAEAATFTPETSPEPEPAHA